MTKVALASLSPIAADPALCPGIHEEALWRARAALWWFYTVWGLDGAGELPKGFCPLRWHAALSGILAWLGSADDSFTD